MLIVLIGLVLSSSDSLKEKKWFEAKIIAFYIVKNAKQLVTNELNFHFAIEYLSDDAVLNAYLSLLWEGSNVGNDFSDSYCKPNQDSVWEKRQYISKQS